MKLLILGGGSNQVNGIIRAKEKGLTTIVSDYYENPPGKAIADYKELVSTFDVEGNTNIGKKHKIDGIMTLGTDQPVYTVSVVSHELELPTFIDVDTAKAVTNKKIMKNLFHEKNIPTVKFAFIKKDFLDKELRDIRFPVVMKPLDSQGQRGVFKLNSIEEVRSKVLDCLSFSREEETLVEEYYPNDEITLSGWVEDSQVYILTVTDRITYDNYPHIGICTAHNFPSKHLHRNYKEIEEITNKIVNAFGIHNGPIYFQMLVGNEGIKVNEIACRIGGAYEDKLIPLLTGIDILDMVIDFSIGRKVDSSLPKDYSLYNNKKKASVQLFFAKPGLIKSLSSMEELEKLPGFIEGGFNFKTGDQLGEIVNATARAGYMIIEGESVEDLERNIDDAFDNLKILDEKDRNLVIKFNTY